ncbi:alpha/beta fold hydrolase [Sphingomonas glacialis]|uniref:Alpha/beta hydrolase n=1 Tax=Sphingomonas glacialis TaxID=658225 RepID=A0A502FAT3_9SPHN|nr:alpha/beta hydrolase [Sphingomonas glacialis]TPG46516.1 alpha/beta hydrolase [Sphingomonas glacialis]
MNLTHLVNGERTRICDTGGEQPVLVLVHGLANSIEIWDRIVPRLSRRFRVIAFDLPGFGQASRPDAAYDAPFFADQLSAVLDTLKIRRAHLVGSSLGASVILRFSEQSPDRIDRAVLAAPGGFGRRTHPLMRLPALPLIGDWLGRPTPFNNALTLKLAMCDPVQVTPDLLELTNRFARVPRSERSFVRTLQTGVGLFGSKDCASVARIAERLDRPTLVVWGRQDRVFPPLYAERAAALLPRSSLCLIDRCGHYPHWEQPEAFATAVEDFLTR